MLEFKLNMYFEEYKDTCIVSVTRFKEEYIKKHGEFELLNELVVMIQKYQYKKYGNLLQTGKIITRNVKKGDFYKKEVARMRDRFGTKEERLKRKLDEKYGRK